MKKILFGNILVKLRKERGYSQKEVADALLVSRPTYVSWENDSGDLPMSKLFLLSNLYHTPVNSLIDMVCAENGFKNLYENSQSQILLQDLISIRSLLEKY